MTDIKILKDSLKKIKCNFTSVNTIIGTNISVYSDACEMVFEFDNSGKFYRTISKWTNNKNAQKHTS